MERVYEQEQEEEYGSRSNEGSVLDRKNTAIGHSVKKTSRRNMLDFVYREGCDSRDAPRCLKHARVDDHCQAV